MILLISLKTLKDKYFFDDNIEDKYILPNIQKGQDFIIKPILGATKYIELLTQIEGGTVTAQNRELIDAYIQPALAYFVMAETIYSTSYKFKNLPLSETNPNSSRWDELVRLSSKWRKDSEWYQQILKSYINNCVVTEPDKSGSTFKTGIYLD